jgi:hypothetical protein
MALSIREVLLEVLRLLYMRSQLLEESFQNPISSRRFDKGEKASPPCASSSRQKSAVVFDVFEGLYNKEKGDVLPDGPTMFHTWQMDSWRGAGRSASLTNLSSTWTGLDR